MIEHPEELTLAILTLRREPQYVHKTLASLLAADAWVHRLSGIHLYVGTQEHEFLDCYRHHRHLVVHPMGQETWDNEVEPLTLGQRLCYNMRRALHAAETTKGILLVEDDIVFRDGFLQTLIDTIREIEMSLGHASYVLAGYFSYDFRHAPEIQRGRLFTAYPCEGFYGTQCMFYPREIVKPLIEYVSRHGFGAGHIPADMVVKKFGTDLHERDAANDGIYACVRPLVQHIGDTSTGLSNEFHQAQTF